MKKYLVSFITFVVIALIVGVIIYSFCRKTCKNGGDHKWVENLDLSFIGGGSPHKEPTCTEDGYTDYKCNYCFETKHEILPALGHTVVVDKAGKAPTCTDAGYAEISHCSVCNEKTSDGIVLEKLPHNGQKVGEDIAPTCTSTGVDAEIICADCGTTLKQKVILPMLAHIATIDIPATEPTCIKTGLTAKSHCSVCGTVLSDQTVIPVTDKHNFGAGFKCADCGETDSEYKAISSVNDLQNINTNLNGKYYLANDINLENRNWTPIGNSYGEFKGIFDGNGFKISNLYYSVDNDNNRVNSIGGLFEVNAGTIQNLTIVNVTFRNVFTEETDNTWSDHKPSSTATYGSFAGNNKGRIENCKVDGKLTALSKRTIKKYFVWAKDGDYSGSNGKINHIDKSTSHIGGIAGNNSGTVNNCVVSAIFSCTAEGLTESKMGYMGGSPTTYWAVEFHGNIGGIVGDNKGSVTSCTFDGEFTFNSNLTANCVKNYGGISPLPVTGWDCNVSISAAVGSVAGYNSGTIEACKSKKPTVNRNHSVQGQTSQTTIEDNIQNNGPNGFYGINENGSIGAIELI